eukprot:TRINITY_DN32486_c0_g1_i1.p1 TRINITY_DN32486_c0_g1~~TRINITY_DN32486_c0_g1_i1.p1  ORF type:complete len:289 (+),score=56.61 TRINITY_DN32486_c0_g1_i1:75-941(+)
MLRWLAGLLAAVLASAPVASALAVLWRAVWWLQDSVYSAAGSMFSRIAAPLIRRWLVVPDRVYFVMDGNRRWARARGLPTAEGHAAGYLTLQRLLSMVQAVGIREVTVYAFSIPNFQRSAGEKSYLMQLATDKLREMMRHGDIIDKYDLRVRVVGQRDRLPASLVEAAEAVEKHTASRGTCTLNIAFAYAARQEMLSSEEGVNLWVPAPEPTERPPLFVRTSGEKRFSDFLTWQSGCAPLVFHKGLWPDYRPWHLAAALLKYHSCAQPASAAARRCGGPRAPSTTRVA